jgi:osmotically-inducible protein OsmY
MRILDEIIDELRCDPRIDASKIAVAVSDGGTVVLNGIVHTYAEKVRAERLAQLVDGVSGVRNEIEVRLTVGDYRADTSLERVIGELFDALTGLPDPRPMVSVRNGWVTLSGLVRWPFQRQVAEEALLHIAGIRGITNAIIAGPGVPLAQEPVAVQ